METSRRTSHTTALSDPLAPKAESRPAIAHGRAVLPALPAEVVPVKPLLPASSSTGSKLWSYPKAPPATLPALGAAELPRSSLMGPEEPGRGRKNASEHSKVVLPSVGGGGTTEVTAVRRSFSADRAQDPFVSRHGGAFNRGSSTRVVAGQPPANEPRAPIRRSSLASTLADAPRGSPVAEPRTQKRVSMMDSPTIVVQPPSAALGEPPGRAKRRSSVTNGMLPKLLPPVRASIDCGSTVASSAGDGALARSNHTASVYRKNALRRGSLDAGTFAAQQRAAFLGHAYSASPGVNVWAHQSAAQQGDEMLQPGGDALLQPFDVLQPFDAQEQVAGAMTAALRGDAALLAALAECEELAPVRLSQRRRSSISSRAALAAPAAPSPEALGSRQYYTRTLQKALDASNAAGRPTPGAAIVVPDKACDVSDWSRRHRQLLALSKEAEPLVRAAEELVLAGRWEPPGHDRASVPSPCLSRAACSTGSGNIHAACSPGSGDIHYSVRLPPSLSVFRHPPFCPACCPTAHKLTPSPLAPPSPAASQVRDPHQRHGRCPPRRLVAAGVRRVSACSGGRPGAPGRPGPPAIPTRPLHATPQAGPLLPRPSCVPFPARSEGTLLPRSDLCAYARCLERRQAHAGAHPSPPEMQHRRPRLGHGTVRDVPARRAHQP